VTTVRIRMPQPHAAGTLELDGHDIADAVTAFTLTWPDDDTPRQLTQHPQPSLTITVDVDQLDLEAADVILEAIRDEPEEPEP